ncbi:ATP-binding protein [Candidatus Shapirobacteria bacterium]|nr:ATP-binding protein [Candidatus Shapirobacteria bacterium]
MIKIKAYYKLRELVKREKLVVVVGPRRVGKTTIIKELVDENPTENAYVLADKLSKRDFKTADELVNYLQFNGLLKKETKTIFIDEAHFLRNLGIILKNFFDEGKYQVVVTGSGSFNIYNDLGNELVGRKVMVYLYPWDFEDYLLAYGKGLVSDMDFEVIKSDLGEFLEWGGYPEVVLAGTAEEKINCQTKIFQSYLDEDVKLLLKREEYFGFEDVLGYLARNVGSILIWENMRRELNLSLTSLRKIKEILDHSFITYHVLPFPLNKAGEIKKHQKTYFVDNGLLNYILRKKILSVSGKLEENFVFSQLLKSKKETTDIYFWQKKNGFEIDFVLYDLLTKKMIPTEVKSGSKDNIPKIFNTFNKAYGEMVDYFVVMNKGIKKVRKMESKEVRFAPMFMNRI